MAQDQPSHSKSIFFASDFHLGLDGPDSSLEREQRIVAWLRSIIDRAEALYLLGDLFDFWFEYKQVVPRGHVRFLGQLAAFTDRGIPVHIFTGNHDMWLFDYLEKELNANIYRDLLTTELQGLKLMLGHGDGLGPGDHGYKFIKSVFRNRINQWLFARLHPNFAIKLMQLSSKTSRESQSAKPFLGKDKEWLVQHCEGIIEQESIDLFIFGHRHLPIDYTLSNGHSRYINSGDWITHNSYVELNQGQAYLKTFEP